MKAFTWAVLAALAFASIAPARAGDGALAPFVAEYDVRYGSMSAGDSRTELRRMPENGRWQFESLSDARGLARLIASSTISQRSTFELEDARLRPLVYRLDDGTRATDQDVSLDFNWSTGRVRGKAEDEPVDIPAAPGLQDAVSIQAYVMLCLRGGTEPGLVAMIEKDRVKEYRYTRLRRERLKTALGVLDTVVYRSAREGSSRESVFWFAPALGYAMVQAEQLRHGKRTWQFRIRRFQDGA